MQDATPFRGYCWHVIAKENIRNQFGKEADPTGPIGAFVNRCKKQGEAGIPVKAGDLIGHTDLSGCTTGSHAHIFRLRGDLNGGIADKYGINYVKPASSTCPPQ